MNIGKVMKDLRESKKIPQKVLAANLGITRTALWKIENGKCYPKRDTILSFCHEMAITPAYLYIRSIDEDDFRII